MGEVPGRRRFSGHCPAAEAFGGLGTARGDFEVRGWTSCFFRASDSLAASGRSLTSDGRPQPARYATVRISPEPSTTRAGRNGERWVIFRLMDVAEASARPKPCGPPGAG